MFGASAWPLQDFFYCRFGTAVVAARRLSAAELVCTAPTLAAAASVPVEVSVDGVNYTDSRVPYFAYAPASVTGVAPTFIPVWPDAAARATGLSVTVTGAFDTPTPGLACSFGQLVVPASW